MKFTLNMNTPNVNGEIIAQEKRGLINGNVPDKYRKPVNRIGSEKTNEEYAKEHGISRRQASKKRRSY